MTMPMNLHPQYITNDNGDRISVILPIEEFNNLIEQTDDIQDLSHLTNQVIDGLNSPMLDQSHEEIFQELTAKYA
ncbi:MAG: hypothetical protein U9R39_10560 [Campylobacterota bacterium]|nr:hypothetical protein [Campylobacterota bacterium]